MEWVVMLLMLLTMVEENVYSETGSDNPYMFDSTCIYNLSQTYTMLRDTPLNSSLALVSAAALRDPAASGDACNTLRFAE